MVYEGTCFKQLSRPAPQSGLAVSAPRTFMPESRRTIYALTLDFTWPGVRRIVSELVAVGLPDLVAYVEANDACAEHYEVEDCT